MSREATRSQLNQAKTPLPKTKKTATLIEAFEKHDEKFTDALNNLANGIEKLAASIEDTNKTFLRVFEKQNETVINLLQIIAKQNEQKTE